MKSTFIIFLCIFIIQIQSEQPKLSLVTGKIFGTESHGVLAAFGDFNSDKHTDIFLINQNGKSVDIALASLDSTYTRKNLITVDAKEYGNKIITSVVPGDFNGDTQMDVLVTWQPDNDADSPVTVEVFWGDSHSIQTDGKTTIEEEFLDQPLVLDANGDMIPDLLGETSPGESFFWMGSKDKNFTMVNITSSINLPIFKRPHGHAFLDLDGDFRADLFLTTMKGLEVWLNVEGEFKWNHTIELPVGVNWSYVGQPTFVDFDQNAEPDLILPLCEDIYCKKSVIMARKHGHKEWVQVLGDLDYDGTTWGFLLPSNRLPRLPVTVRTGDYNMDGYPDATIVLSDLKMPNRTRAFLLENVASSTGNLLGRVYQLDGTSIPNAITDLSPYLSAFYDIQENGVLDVLVATNQSQGFYIKALEHSFTSDACFVKVTVVGGLCYSNCPNGKPPYGVNQPGPAIKYMTTKAEGDTQHSCATQLSQAAYFALQLPFTVFGLGQTPNFVDKLEVGIPTYTKGETRQRGWTQIIPNSQLIVVPYPNDQPKKWKNKLFVTPSRLVLLTGAALIGTCGFIAGIVGILHWREKREDKKEKLQDAHRFHFDAM